MGSFIDDDDAFGPEKSRAARWQFAVRALDKFVPHWFQKEGRRVVGGMGQAAARAIEALVTRSRELARERDEAMRQLAERPVTYKVLPRKYYSYNATLAGADENAPYRWTTVVRFLDQFIPSWAPRNNREENPTLGGSARIALENLIKERDDARTELEKLRNREEKRQRDTVGAMGAMYGSNPQLDQFKTESNYPQWKDSYTKHVVDQLYRAQWKVAHGGLDAAIRAAADLLRDYHATNHEVYEQRDQARKELQAVTASLALLRAECREAHEAHRTAIATGLQRQKERDGARKAAKEMNDRLVKAEKRTGELTHQITTLQLERNAAIDERDNLRGRIRRATNELTINRIVPPAPPPDAYVDCAGRYW